MSHVEGEAVSCMESMLSRYVACKEVSHSRSLVSHPVFGERT